MVPLWRAYHLVEQIELKALVMDTKVKIKPSKAGIDRALACAILSRVDRLSVHTKAALEKISRRLLDGEPVAHDEWRRVVYSYFATTMD